MINKKMILSCEIVDEERVEDEGDPLQCEIEAPSGNTSDDAAQYCVSNGSTMKENDFDDFVFRYFIQRFKHLDLSRYVSALNHFFQSLCFFRFFGLNQYII